MDRARKKERRDRGKGSSGDGERMGERESYKDRKKSRETESLRGQRGPDKEGNVWWGVQVKELNSGSQRN